MALHHQEFELRLRDDEQLRLFVQAGMAERGMQRASLKKAELACRRLELEARESTEKAARAESERDATCHEAAMAKLATEGAVNTRAHIESELAWVQRALTLEEEARRRAEFEHGATQETLAVTGEACKKAEEENGHLADEKIALVIELGALKDDFSTFREKAVADREAVEAEFDSSGDTLFNYGYGCYAFTHNICESKPQIPDGMPNPSVPLSAEFFANPRCPLSASVAASALAPIAVSGKKRSENSLVAAGEKAVLPTDLPTE